MKRACNTVALGMIINPDVYRERVPPGNQGFAILYFLKQII